MTGMRCPRPNPKVALATVSITPGPGCPRDLLIRKTSESPVCAAWCRPTYTGLVWRPGRKERLIMDGLVSRVPGR
jgi:hypothetical protein